MPKRKRIERFFSDEVQGEGSWVLVAKFTVEEMRELRKLGKLAEKTREAGTDDGPDMFEVGITQLKSHIKEWNWVWDDDTPMPQPKDDPEVIEKLSDPESAYLSKCLQGSEEDAKN